MSDYLLVQLEKKRRGLELNKLLKLQSALSRLGAEPELRAAIDAEVSTKTDIVSSLRRLVESHRPPDIDRGPMLDRDETLKELSKG